MAIQPSDATIKARSKKRFKAASRLENEYLRSLRGLVRNIDQLIKGMITLDGSEKDTSVLINMLEKYAETISPWAESVASKILQRIFEKDAQSWAELGRDVGKALKKELDDAPTGYAFRLFMDEQVKLIKSLPLDAARRVHDLTIEGITTSRRADDIAKDILKIGNITMNRAKLIARTEVARTASGITMERAKSVGSTHYIWRTSGDADVRESHKHMANKIIAWDNPPEVDPGKHYHAGMFPNCRCYPEPILIEE